MDVRAWMHLADQAALDPSLSQDAARRLASAIRAAIDSGEWDAIPLGYLYAGAHKLIATVSDLEAEDIGPPPAPPLTGSGNTPQVEWRMPFDALIIGVSGWATPRFVNGQGGVLNPWPFSLSGAIENRDLFSVRWSLNGSIEYQTTGFSQSLMLPASVVVGTGNRPRPMAWMVGRQDVISFQFRNLTNAFGEVFRTTLQEAAVTMACLRLDPP